jgi:flagellar biosynthesis protein FliQ
VWSIAFKLLLPMLGAILIGGISAAALRMWTQLDEQSVSFMGRLAGIIIFFLVMSDSYFRPVVEFASQTWGNFSTYH